ncbi:hypothetical protein CDAR_209511 [Caerostris darwini]|uniref:Uncharacterized protein n=1 Tax=Caerostris darwini TaxID=1538125 RepID=A0AAV4T1W5_9ARAC|nr:hypothetical protein CDAR_209511 [Caerostris darwini]
MMFDGLQETDAETLAEIDGLTTLEESPTNWSSHGRENIVVTTIILPPFAAEVNEKKRTASEKAFAKRPVIDLSSVDGGGGGFGEPPHQQVVGSRQAHPRPFLFSPRDPKGELQLREIIIRGRIFPKYFFFYPHL